MKKGYDFWLSPFYIGLVATVAWMGNMCGKPWGILFFVFLFGFILCVRKDCTPVVPLVFMVVQASGSPLPDGKILSLSCLFLGICVLIRIFRFPPHKNTQKVNLFSLSCILFVVAIGLGGLLFPQKGDYQAVIILCCMGCILFILLCRTSFLCGEKTVDFVCQTLIASSLLACVQLLSVMFGAENIMNIIGNKESLSVGFGSSNQVSNIIARALPVYFYYSVRNKKCAVLWLLPAFGTMLLLLIPLARATLTGVAVIVVVSVLLCFKKAPKKVIWVTVLLFCITTMALLLIQNPFYVTLLTLLKQRGIEDGGRLLLWQSGWELFLQNPIFGTGIGYRWGEMNAGQPFWYHNTVVQTMACFGTVGLCSLLFFIIVQYRYMKSCEHEGADFLLLALLLIQIISFLDVHFYTPQDFLEMLLLGFCRKPEKHYGSLEMPRI